MVLSPLSGSKANFEEGYRAFFNQVTGFIVVEDTIMKTTSKGFLTKGEVDVTWEMATSKVQGVLQERLAHCNSIETLLRVKDCLSFFMQTMKNYGYRVSQLLLYLENTKERFYQLLVSQCSEAFAKVAGFKNHLSVEKHLRFFD